MASLGTNQTSARLEAVFGTGWARKSPEGSPTTVWETSAYHLVWAEGGGSESDLRGIWEARKGRHAYAVVLLAPSSDPSKLRVAGPQSARPVRVLPAGRVVELLEASHNLAAREAASLLAREFSRLEEAVVPGVRVKDFLTPHFLRDRLRWPINEQRLSREVEGFVPTGGMAWRPLFQGLGYQVEQLPKRGYLLRHGGTPVAVVHPHSDASQFSRLTDNGELPEGMVLADCAQHGVDWGVLAAEGRYRLFQRKPPVGPATGQHLELDVGELERNDRFYLGLLAPESLRENGWLSGWVREAKDFGEELRKGLEERLVKDALPNVARGLGEYVESEGADLSDRATLRQIEEAALTLVFRFMFLLHTEARGYLPIGSAAYRPHSARQLAEDSRLALSSLSGKSTQRWDRLRTLVRMVRTGDRSASVPAYNGSLFAAAGFPGSALLERAGISDAYLAPALVAIAHETDKADAPGLDYAGLQIGHLGAIYEALLTLRLTRAPEDLVYDAMADVFRPLRAGEKPEVTRAQLYYQTEAGGRKAGGVFYTRHEFVQHLLHHSLLPALDDHLDEVRKIGLKDPGEAARRLFDFSVVDPAMGSAHFLTAALDMMADRIELFLAEIDGLPAIRQQISALQEGGEASQRAEDGDLLRRLILKRCIYGVDISPMAVEVANVTLWLTSFIPGLALSYLGSNLKCGDALVGVADPSVLGDVDKDRMFTGGQEVLDAMQRAADVQRALGENPDRTPEEVHSSEVLADRLRQATAGLRDAFNLWAAEPLGLRNARGDLQLHGSAIVASSVTADYVAEQLALARATAGQHRLFHWPLEFPHVFHRERPGFDVVVGNPPWNKVKFEMPSFLALHDPGIRGLRSSLDRDERAERLFQQRPELLKEIEEIKRQVEEQREFFRPENGYSIQGSGDTDLYKLFCERYASIVREQGFIGVVLPRVAFLNDGSRGFRRWFFKECRPSRIDALLNNRQWAFDIHPQYAIALVAARTGAPVNGSLAVTGPARNEQEFAECVGSQGVQVELAALASWTPAPADDSIKEPTWELPLLPTTTHVSVLGKLRGGVRFDQLQDPEDKKIRKDPAAAPNVVLYRELDSAQQRGLFTHPPGGGRIPVLKGQSVYQYEPDWGEPAGYGNRREIDDFVAAKYAKTPICLYGYEYGRIAFRRISRSTDSRTTIACLVPPYTPLTDALACIAFGHRGNQQEKWSNSEKAYILGLLNSLPFDWLARRYVETTFNHFIMYGMTVPVGKTAWERIGTLAARLSCVDERFAEFAQGAGVEYGPLVESERRNKRAEIDALVARAYDLTVDELQFIFTDFTENAVSTPYRHLVVEKFKGL